MSNQQGKELKKIARIMGLPKNAQVLVGILGNLSGWSKRYDLIQNEIERELNRKIQQKSLYNLIHDLQSLELVEIRTNHASPRVHLMHDVWDYPVALFTGIKDITTSNALSARADISEKGIRKKVKQDALDANPDLKKLPNRFWRAVVATTLKYDGSKEWELVNGSLAKVIRGVERITFNEPRNKVKKPTNVIDESSQQILFKKEDISDGPEYSDAQRLDAYGDLLHKLESWQDGRVVTNHLKASITISFPLGRKQTVWVSVRKNLAGESLCWLGSLCGKLGTLDADVVDILVLNNQLHTHKITVHDINGEMYIMCTDLLFMRGEWLSSLPRMVLSLSMYADSLEDKYWSEDIY